MRKKSESLTFRAPAELRRAIKWGAKKEGKSQSNFMMDAVLAFIEQLDASDEIQALLLPETFEIPKKNSKTMSILVAPELPALIQDRAPRFYHSATRLTLWASATHAYRLIEQLDASNEIPKKDSKPLSNQAAWRASLTFRAPAELRRAIKEGADREGKSQSEFMTDAVLAFIEQLDASDEIQALLLPEAFEIPKEDSKMMSIRVAPALPTLIQNRAPRFYHSATCLILWASALHAYHLIEQAKKPKIMY